MRQGQVEVLAPAGSFESMKAAIGAGADGVYIGGSRFGARAYADNLDQERMLEAIDYAHFHGVSLYMTVNTLMKEEELRELPHFLAPYYEQGLDGVIVQDLGAVSVIRRCFEDLPVHASTQMTITGVHGARLLADLGVKRVVTARELSLEEIRQIHEKVPIEIECFVHGALCYCYSGQCLLSSFIGGRSGNRGRCAQPCRLPYRVREQEGGKAQNNGRDRAYGRAGSSRERGGFKGDKASGKGRGAGREDSFLLSMKDLCTLDLIPDLIQAGVNSLKIEGRMKSPRYTAGVVRIYRKYVDQYYAQGKKGYRVDPADKKELLDLFDRGGLTEGYYRQHNGPDMIAVGKKPAFRQADQRLFEELDKLYVDGEKKEPVKGVLTVKEGQEICLELEMGGGRKDEKEPFKVTVRGPRAQTARNQPMSREQLEKQIRRAGDMPFVWERLDICLEGQVFLPVQALNQLRRQGLEQLKDRVTNRYRRTSLPLSTGLADEKGKEKEREEGLGQKTPRLCVLLSSEEGMGKILDVPQVLTVYMEADGLDPKRWSMWARDCHAHGKSAVLAMPVIFRTQAERFFEANLAALFEAGLDGILVRSLEEIEYLRRKGVKIPVYGDHNLYSFNSAAQDLLLRLGCKRTTFPLELNSREIGGLSGEKRELIGYGFLPAMVSAQCVRKNIWGCSKKPERLVMLDRIGKELFVENHCAYCYNIIYNPSPLRLLDETKRIRKLGLEAVRLQFTKESPQEIRQMVDAWVDGLYGGLGSEDPALETEDQGRKKRGRQENDPGLPGDFTRGHFRRGVE